ncbi:MAG: type II secretion system F family protein [Alphaproteobacteria bacterium]|nr:type II secretion system F family protein [Alphaproteobacteria bacterium]
MDMNILIVAVGVSITMLTIIVMLLSGSAAGRVRKNRLETLEMLRKNNVRLPSQTASVRKQINEKSRFLELLKRYMPKRQVIERKLEQTGKSISLGQYAAITLICILISFSAILILFNFGLLVSILAAVGLGILLPFFVIKQIADRRLAAFLKEFPDAIDLMVRGLRSGLPVSEGIKSVGNEFGGPVGAEFRRVMDEVQFGTELENALWSMAERLPAPDVKFFVITLSIQKDTGGNLADTLANLSNILRSRKQMVLKIRALSSEAKASAMILGSLPFVLFAILSFLAPEYIFMLFQDPRGHVMLMIGGGLICIGIVIMRNMVRFKI